MLLLLLYVVVVDCNRIIKKTESAEGRYSEQDAALIVKNILSGIAYCHTEHNICHRDLKVRMYSCVCMCMTKFLCTC